MLVYRQYMLLLVLAGLFVGCSKYLDKKPRQDLAIPSTLNELQAVLDNQIANTNSVGDLEFVADNYYVTDASWSSTVFGDQKAYVWDKEFGLSTASSWNSPYQAIYYCNFVLENLPKITEGKTDKERYNNIMGTALFFRAFLFYQLAQIFCKPYTASAATDAGIVLRLTPNISEKSVRATVQQTYDQLISDLKKADSLLPVNALFSTRPNKAAAYGALARAYLSMRNYENAGAYAQKSLDLYDTLKNYNTLTPASDPVLPNSFVNNPEILYLSKQNNAFYLLSPATAIIDSILFRSYSDNDLRKKVFFGNNNGNSYFDGCYATGLGSSFEIFDGIATDEMYLISAECLARAGRTTEAMANLNTLLRNRYVTGTFNGLSATDAADALQQILTERRKELAFRGIRWSDLRRLNLEGANITLIRKINGTVYSLPPNDLRWVLLIPSTEITRSGLTQNPR